MNHNQRHEVNSISLMMDDVATHQPPTDLPAGDVPFSVISVLDGLVTLGALRLVETLLFVEMSGDDKYTNHSANIAEVAM